MKLNITQTLSNIDITTAFQEVAKLNINALEDAGCGMYNATLDIFSGEDTAILQLYPNNEYHEVWVLLYDEFGEHEDCEITDFPQYVQKIILKKFINYLGLDNMVRVD